MKKVLVVILVLVCLVLCGCMKKTEDDILKEFSKKIAKTDSYYLTGTLEMMNNETIYTYDVNVSYTKDNNFKVSLKNQANDHEQIILRNKDGVYVVTPSLNKSFKFQSEWPYNNSQAYLLQTIVEDLESDKEFTFEEKDDKYIFTSTVNYSNNADLKKQKVTISKDYNIETVEVLDNDGTSKIKMIFNDIDYNAKFSNDYYNLEQNVSSEVDTTETSETSKVEDIIYPMYMPSNTTLSSQDKVTTETGERVILTFDGDSPFTLIQENVTISDEFTTIPVLGEPVMLGDIIGVLEESAITWISNDMQYYLASSTLNNGELLEVARSVGAVSVIK